MLSFRGKIEFSKKRTGKCLAVRSSSFFMPFLRLDKSITLPVSQVNDRADFYWNVRTVSALSKHSETPIYRDKQPIFARFGTRLLRGGRSTPPLTPLTPLARPTVNSPLQSLPLSTFRCSGRAGAYAPRRGRALSRVVGWLAPLALVRDSCLCLSWADLCRDSQCRTANRQPDRRSVPPVRATV